MAAYPFDLLDSTWTEKSAARKLFRGYQLQEEAKDLLRTFQEGRQIPLKKRLSPDKFTSTYQVDLPRQLVIPDAEDILGDVLGNYRSALDFIATDLASNVASPPADARELAHVYFPICPTEASWNKVLKNPRDRWMQRIPPEYLDRIRSTQPLIASGDGHTAILMWLHEFNNFGKHQDILKLRPAVDTSTSIDLDIRNRQGEFIDRRKVHVDLHISDDWLVNGQKIATVKTREKQTLPSTQLHIPYRFTMERAGLKSHVDFTLDALHAQVLASLCMVYDGSMAVARLIAEPMSYHGWGANFPPVSSTYEWRGDASPPGA